MRMGLSKGNIIKYKYRGTAKKICFYLAVAIVLTFFLIIIARLRSAFLRVMVPYAINIGSDAINYTVSDYFRENSYSYEDFVTLSYNNDNEITAVQTDSALMNKVKADLSIYLQEQVDSLKASTVSVPIGSIFDNPVFAGFGPDIKLKVKPTDITDLVFSDSFEACGINQVRHKIYIEVFINISIHCATMTKTEIIEDTIPIAETVIVGRVPSYYGAEAISLPGKAEEE